jgi:polyphosphate kinase 2 (PPK2 family)
MLETLDFNKKVSKSEYKSKIPDLEIKLGVLQRKAKQLGIPVIVVFEGWDAAGKGTLINRLLLALDPRGFKVHPINPPTREENLRPFLWRFWNKIPQKGEIAIFDRSWYGRVLVERVDKIVKKNVWIKAYEEINSFENQLADDGYILIKFFLHITRKEQKKRFKKLEKSVSTSWKVTKDDWRHHKQYDKYWASFEDMLAKTDTEWARWTIIEAMDRRYAVLKLFQAVIDRVSSLIEEKVVTQKNKPKVQVKGFKVTRKASVLSKVELDKSIGKEEYQTALKQYQKKMRKLEHEVFLQRLPLVIIYEGWDAAGKGGNIKRLVQGMDPRGYEVIPFAAPNEVEKAHHYLWRFWIRFPKAGHIAIFDRSWYGRVLVERVEGFCKKEEWQRAYREINEMELQWVNFGTVLIKFWLQIDKAEQLKRFKEREETPHKNWKITEEDWRNREKWDTYENAVNEMLIRTGTPYAPWTVIESNCKWYARLKVIRTVIERVEEKLRK